MYEHETTAYMQSQYADELTNALWSDMADTVLIAGDTYRHRAALRAMGGTWNKGAQAWAIPTARKDDALKLRGLEVR